MRTLIYISLFAFAGCTTLLAPQEPQPPSGSDLAGYFWPDATASYRYESTFGIHKVVTSGGTIFDYNQNGATTTFTVTKSNGSFSLSGFTPSDIFGFDPSLQIVSDTVAPGPHVEAIHSIATFGQHGKQSTLYALSNSTLYKVD